MVPDKTVLLTVKDNLVKQYLTNLLKLCDKKYPCQVVPYKPVLLSVKDNLVKQYLTRLSKLCDRNTLVKQYLTSLL